MEFKLFQALAKKHKLVPLTEKLLADLETPLSLYLKLREEGSETMLLESADGGEKWGRYSFLLLSAFLRYEARCGFAEVERDNKKTRVKTQNPIQDLKKIFQDLVPAQVPGLPRFCGGAVGTTSYDLVRFFEKLPNTSVDLLDFPDALFLFSQDACVYDHLEREVTLITWVEIKNRSGNALRKQFDLAQARLKRMKNRLETPFHSKSVLQQTEASKPILFRSNMKPEVYAKNVEKIKKYIQSGDIVQSVLSQRFETDQICSPVEAYRALRQVNPSPYLFLMEFKNFALVGSSPEILVRKEGRIAETRPIAGTRPRGKSESEDLRNEKELLADPKECAEHLMLVDLGRNDVGRVAELGSVEVPKFMTIERYSHVMHIVSFVKGLLGKKEDAFSLFQAAFPAGTVSGAPKIRAMEIIEELENLRRGYYSGAVGYFSFSGDMDMAIAIRTMLFQDKKIYVQAGAGIVADSVPKKEELETRSKAQALFKALSLAKNFAE